MVKLLFILLISAIVTGVSPLSHHMSSMPTMHMDEIVLSHPSSMGPESNGENSTRSCCDEIAPFSQGCSFLIPAYSCVDLAEGGKQVISTKPIAQYIYIETVTPPPKA